MTEMLPTFEECWEAVGRRAAGNEYQYSILYEELVKARKRSGHFAEVGAYRGASGKMMAMLAPDKEVHLFETFTGLPEPSPLDTPSTEWERGSLTADQEDTEQFLADCPNIRIHAGLFPSTGVCIHDHMFALVHLDADLFEGTRDGILFFARRLAPGGVILCHDYNNSIAPGVSKAVIRYAKLLKLSKRHIGEFYVLLQKSGGL